MSSKNTGAIFLFRIIPTSLLSRIFGWLTEIPLPGIILKPVIRWYSKKFNIIDEYVIPENGFRTFNDFFTRKLKEGSRAIDKEPGAVISPVDSRIDSFGTINDNTLLQAKGVPYSLEDLLLDGNAEDFRNGSYITLYLSPADYHRIHSPVSGKISGFTHIPGRLFTVQEYMVKGLGDLFTRNERITTYIETGCGDIAVCKIGAMNVGRISLAYSDTVSNRTFRSRKQVTYQQNEMPGISAGDELAVFNLGSTIILLFQPGIVDFTPFTIGDYLRVGEKIGTLSAHRS